MEKDIVDVMEDNYNNFQKILEEVSKGDRAPYYYLDVYLFELDKEYKKIYEGLEKENFRDSEKIEIFTNKLIRTNRDMNRWIDEINIISDKMLVEEDCLIVANLLLASLNFLKKRTEKERKTELGTLELNQSNIKNLNVNLSRILTIDDLLLKLSKLIELLSDYDLVQRISCEQLLEMDVSIAIMTKIVMYFPMTDVIKKFIRAIKSHYL